MKTEKQIKKMETFDLSLMLRKISLEASKRIRSLELKNRQLEFKQQKDPEKSDYPNRTAQDLEIADLKRENNAAAERIQKLSQALCDLGYDPTQLT